MQKAPEDPSSNDRRHFQFEKAGDLWMSDVMHGPAVTVAGKRKAKAYLIAFLDDATRIIPFAAFALSENTEAFLGVFKQALMRRGLPTRLYVDCVTGNTIYVMCPLGLCGGSAGSAGKQLGGPANPPHNQRPKRSE